MSQTPKRILVGLSCDPDSEGRARLAAADRHAFEHAAWLAEQCGAALRIIHVVDFIVERLARELDVASAIERDLDDEMKELAERVKATRVFRRGKAWEQLVEEAKSFAADLVVIAPRRKDLAFTDRIFHGSTAARVMRHAPCPVWVVPPISTTPPKRLLALIDGSPASAAIVAASNALAERLGLERHVLRCLDYPHDIVLHRLPDAQKAIATYHRNARADARKEIEALTSAAWIIHLGDDWVVREAPKLVASEKIDLVMLSTGQHESLSAMLGLTAEKLLQRMNASAWLIRPPVN